MSEYRLKPGWTRVKFGDVVRQVKDKVDVEASGLERYIAGEHMDTDDLRIRRWGTIDDGYLGPAFHMRFKPGQVLYGSRRTYLRKVAVPDFEGICANTTFVLESKDPTILLPQLLPFIMQTELFHDHSIKQSKGSVNPYINFSDLAWYEFALPALEVQNKFLNLLQKSADMLEAYRDLTEKAHLQYISAVLYLFQKGTKESNAIEQNNLCYPDSWKLLRIDDCFHLQLGKMSSAKSREGNNHYFYLKNNNVLWGEFDFSELSSMSFNEAEQKKFSLRKGDLLVCEGGEIGRAAVWNDEYPNLFYQKAIHRLRPKSSEYSTEFLMHYLRYCSLRGILNSLATGTTIAHLPAEKLAAIVLPFPDRDEQEAIVNILNTTWLSTKMIRNRETLALEKYKALLTLVLEG